MLFDTVLAQEKGGGFKTIKNREAFACFCQDFQPAGVSWGYPLGMSSALLKKKLLEGQEITEEQIEEEYEPEEGEISSEMNEWYHRLFDHCSMWQRKDGSIFVISFPYGTDEEIVDSFEQFKKEYGFPDQIHMHFLDSQYAFRPNGDRMVIIQKEDQERPFAV